MNIILTEFETPKLKWTSSSLCQINNFEYLFACAFILTIIHVDFWMKSIVAF